MSSIRETAERIAERYHPSQTLTQNAGLIADIERELRNERERAAKIAETSFEEFQTGYNAGKWIAAAIRKDD